MIRQLPKVAMFGLLVVGIACASKDDPRIGGDVRSAPTAPVEMGDMLFVETAWPRYTDEAAVLDPIRIPLCHLTVLDRVDIPSQEEGTLFWLGTELKEGEAAEGRDVFFHKRTKKQFRRLRPGDKVEADQIVAVLNDLKASTELAIAEANIKGAEAEASAAARAIDSYEAILKIEKEAERKGAGHKEQRISAEANVAKSVQEKIGKDWTTDRTRHEKQRAEYKLDNHIIRAPIKGVVVQLLKQIGEGVKPSEPILQIQNISRLGVEGHLPVQYVRKVALGAEVFLEPAILESPLPIRPPHTSSKPIAAVAVGVRGGKQVVVSASEDGTVHVWDRFGVYATWKHTGAVRSLAVTRSGVKPGLILTGCDDGKARLYSLDELGNSATVTLAGHHEGGVQAVAFSPDGKTCVTADDRGDIYLSDTLSGKLLYGFPHEHNGSVSSLHFTPQCRVVSAGRDNVAYVWKVGVKSAEVETSFDHRSGEVANLGVSDDGGQMLLDLDKSRLQVVELSNNRNLGTLQQTGDGKFTSFSLISPTIGDSASRVLLTTSGNDGVLQVWRWTAGPGRGSELKKLVCTGYVAPTCAAFSPIAKDGFIVVGTRKGEVHLWPMPVEQELAQRYKARIAHIDPNLESSGKTVRINAEFDNPDDPLLRLRPGTTATMVIPQR